GLLAVLGATQAGTLGLDGRGAEPVAATTTAAIPTVDIPADGASTVPAASPAPSSSPSSWRDDDDHGGDRFDDHGDDEGGDRFDDHDDDDDGHGRGRGRGRGGDDD